MTEPLDPAEDPELDELAVTGEDEPDEVSIDDALETDRVAAEGPDSRNADGYGFDTDRDRGLEESAAAEQGNRDEDRMEADADDGQIEDVLADDSEL